MDIRVRASAKNDASTGTNVTVAEPTGAQVGDLIVVFIHGNNQTTIVDNNGSTPFLLKWIDDYKPNTSNGHVMACFSRRKRTGDPSSYSFTLGTSGRWSAISVALYDFDGKYAWFDVAPSTANAGGVDNSSSGQITIPAITTGINNAMHIVVGGWDTSAIGTISTPSGYTLIQNANDNNGEPMHASYKIIASAGSTGNPVIDNTEFGARLYYSFSVKAVNVTADPIFQEQKTVDASSAAVTSFTPLANALYLLGIASKTEISTDPNQPTASGCGITWSIPSNGTVVYDNSGASRRRLAVFQGLNASPSAGQITVDYNSQTQTGFCWVLIECLGVDTTTPVVQAAQNSSQTAVTSITATLGAFGSSNNATVGFFANGRGDLTITPGSGFLKIGEKKEQTEGNFDVVASYRGDNDTTVDFSFASDSEMCAIGVEVAASTGAPATAVKDIIGNGVVPFAR